MTPAINILKKAKIKYQIHKYNHDPVVKDYGKEAAEKLDIAHDKIFKTLVISVDKKVVSVAVVPVSKQLNMKLFAKVMGVKKAKMADKNQVEKITGYLLGGVSPIGQKRELKTIIDSSALTFNTVYVSAGRRGLQIEIYPEDLALITKAGFHEISN